MDFEMATVILAVLEISDFLIFDWLTDDCCL